MNPDYINVRGELEAPDAPKGSMQQAAYLEQKNQLIKMRQIMQGTAWEDIERELRHNDFWSFLGEDPEDIQPTRIGTVLKIYTGQFSDYQHLHPCYDFLEEQIKKKRDNQDIWLGIIQTWEFLKYWHQDNDLYHRIGLITNLAREESFLKKLHDLRNKAIRLSKQDFYDYVSDTICAYVTGGTRAVKNKLGLFRTHSFKASDKNEEITTLDELDFSYQHNLIKTILTIFNVEYCRRSDGTRRFRFDMHQDSTIELEHIQARATQSLTDNIGRRRWLEWQIKFLKELDCDLIALGRNNAGEDGQLEMRLSRPEEIKMLRDDYLKRCEEMLSRLNASTKVGDDSLKDIFANLYAQINSFLADTNQVDDNSIYNLALLPKDKNIKISNYEFGIKREMIRQWLNNNNVAINYIPPATADLFLRHFSDRDIGLPWWNSEDRKGYGKVLSQVLGDLFPEWQ